MNYLCFLTIPILPLVECKQRTTPKTETAKMAVVANNLLASNPPATHKAHFNLIPHVYWLN